MKNLLDPPSPRRLTPKPRRRLLTSHVRRFKRILVPIDFSSPSLKAIPYALAISRQFGAAVHLLHVTDFDQLPRPTLMTLPLVPQAEWNRRFMKRLEALALKHRTYGKVSTLEPRTGTAYEEICTAARELKADLIVIATHGYTGYKRAFLGSTAERVVQHSPCPVLVVRQHTIGPWNSSIDPRTRTGFRLRTILVPTDFSECSRVGFEYGLQLARDCNAELRLVHVINPHVYPFGDEHAALDSARLTDEAARAAQRRMRDMAAKTGVRCSAEVSRGSPAGKICNAGDKDADLIIISTHGRTGLGHALIGSTAERVVHSVRCPVLVIPTRDSQTQLNLPYQKRKRSTLSRLLPFAS